jgi:NAD(P)H-quinone oxidoreductase subunit 4L
MTEYLLLASALFSIGLYGALSQQSIVMIMMGLELMINAVIVGAITAMAIEMAAGFAVTTAIFRARDVDMTDMAADLKD